MFCLKFVYLNFKSKSYFWFGLLIGLFISLNYPNDETHCDDSNSWKNFLNSDDVESFKLISDLKTVKPKLNTSKPPLSPKKVLKTITRPRYYSTELGIREKLFVGVITSFENLDTIGVAYNVTLNQHVNKLKYFVQTLHNRVRDAIPLSNVVGFTDTRDAHRPFHIFKYIADNFIQDYDYFFLLPDKAYLNVHRLKAYLSKISVTQDVYTGVKAFESSYCSMDAGILLSNSVIQKIKQNLEWCVKNAIMYDHTDNIGRCTVKAIGKDCQEIVQGQEFTTFKAQFFSIREHLKELIHKPDLHNAITVYPILSAEDIYTLHTYFSQQTLIDIQQQIHELRESIVQTTHLHPAQYTDISWPIGEKRAMKPATRHDVIRYDLVNTTHVFMRDDFQTIRPLTITEKNDLEIIIDAVVAKLKLQYGDKLKYRRLVNGYTIFDPSRGLDYILDMGMRDPTTGKETIKRMEVSKLLGRAEILPVPYVTENSRVNLILPIRKPETHEAIQFVSTFGENLMTRREKSFLMLTFLYGINDSSKGKNDIYYNIKQHALKINEKYKSANSGIAWVSIRFPTAEIPSNDKKITLTIIDLALRKIGLDALVLFLDVYSDIRYDFLNRVRMNTILNYQAFFPVPFVQYDPKISEREDLDIHKSVGHFDSNEFGYFSFYARDYIKTRRKTEKQIPIVRTDKDIPTIMAGNYTEFENVFEYFVKNNNLHYFRAIEPSLKIKFHQKEYSCDNANSITPTGSKAQLGSLIIKYNSTINTT